MHTATTGQKTPASAPPRDLIVGEPGSPVASASDPRFAQYKVIRRNGAVVGFEPAKITIAMAKAFLAVHGGQGAASSRVRDEVTKLTDAVVAALMKRKPEGGAIHIEEIQDQVELALMRGGEHEVARAYVLYREKRAQERAQEKQQKGGKAPEVKIFVIENGVRKPLDLARLTELVKTSCAGLTAAEPERILKATHSSLHLPFVPLTQNLLHLVWNCMLNTKHSGCETRVQGEFHAQFCCSKTTAKTGFCRGPNEPLTAAPPFFHSFVH